MRKPQRQHMIDTVFSTGEVKEVHERQRNDRKTHQKIKPHKQVTGFASLYIAFIALLQSGAGHHFINRLL